MKAALPSSSGTGSNGRGWHAFRRSVASNLFALRVKPKIIPSILCHADISMTLDSYVKVKDEEVSGALEKTATRSALRAKVSVDRFAGWTQEARNVMGL